MKYLILLGFSLGLVACKEPMNTSNVAYVEILRDKQNPCIVYIWNRYATGAESYVAQIIGCDPNQNQRLPE